MNIDKLNASLMNIQCEIPEEINKILYSPALAYKRGHRDARHAAVEVVLEHSKEETPTDDMIDAYFSFVEQGCWLHHPKVPYFGTFKGDSEEKWKRRYATELIKTILNEGQ